MRSAGRTGRGPTVAEIRYPHAPKEMVATAKRWSKDASGIMLDAVWRGFDKLKGDSALTAAMVGAEEDVERGITEFLALAIEDVLTREEPFRLLHGAFEQESRKDAPAQPPAYDIAFVYRENIRIRWPIEAKVIPSGRRAPTNYVATATGRLLTGTYAPFTPAGAMVGYVLTADVGASDRCFASIAEMLGCTMRRPNAWRNRRHRMSSHKRNVPKGKYYPVKFLIHHLMMEFADLAPAAARTRR